MRLRFKTNTSRAFAVLAVSLAGCRNGVKLSPSIGEAYVGPANVQIRGDTTPQSPVVATAKHGDRLEILREKRKMLMVRTAGGAEGWADERQLLAASDMAALKELAARAAQMPGQGQATTFGDLRVHTQPSYQAPSFLLIKANEKFDVLTHVVLPRMETTRAPLVPPPPKKAKTERKTAPKNPKLLPPPMPRLPAPPPDWLDLSKSTLPKSDPAPEEARPEKPVPTDRWSLIRTSTGESGWVYTRMISMAIPDEVAQYAEGHRIVAYLPLGSVQDGNQNKPTWLWTTVAAGNPPYDFDSFRVFVWSIRHHRYETGHVELHLKGYLPVLLESVEVPAAGKSKADAGKLHYSGFSVCTQKKDGNRYRREYAFYNEKIRFVEEHPCEPPSAPVTVKAAAPLPGLDKPAVEPPKETFVERMKKRWQGLTKHLFGG